MKFGPIFKNIIRILVGTILSVFIGLIILLNIPYIQKNLSMYLAHELSEKLNTEVSIGKVDLGLLNRAILEDVVIKDQKNKELLNVSHLAAKIDILPLFKNKISISTVQLFNFKIQADKEGPKSPTNFQFIIDAFSSKEKNKNSKLDLRINSILIRNGNLCFDILSKNHIKDKFDPNHINIKNLAAIVSLKALTNDSINARIRRMSFSEQSGFILNRLSVRATANNKQLNIKSIEVDLPHSYISANHITIKYSKLANLFKFSDDVSYKANIKAYTSLSDFAAFVPSLNRFKQSLDFGFNIKGDNKNIECSSFNFTDHSGMTMQGYASATNFTNKERQFFSCNFQNLNLTNRALNNLSNSLNIKLPQVLSKRDFINFKGETCGNFNNIILNGKVLSDVGEIKSNISLNIDKDKIRTYSGKVECNKLMLNKLLDNDEYGDIDFNVNIKGFSYKDKYPQSYIKGNINSVTYKNYKYNNITMDGEFKNGGFDGKLNLDDSNISLALNGSFNTLQNTPSFNLKAKIKDFNPYNLNLTKSHKDSKYDFSINANFTGNSLDNLNGSLSIDSLSLISKNSIEYFLPYIKAETSYNNNVKELSISSPFMNGNIKGDYSYSTLSNSIISTIQRYIPSIINTKEKKGHQNNFSFNLNINDSEFFSKLFDIPIDLEKPANMHGYFNDNKNSLEVEAYLPTFKYSGASYESGVLICKNTKKNFFCNVRAGVLMGSGAMVNVSINNYAQNDSLLTTINWGNNTNITYGGTLSAVTKFIRNTENKNSISANVNIQPSKVILNDSIWNIHPSKILVNNGNVEVNNFLFEHDNQHLMINGALTKNVTDSLDIDLKNINLEYILNIVHFDDVKFGGIITGNVILKDLLTSPDMKAKLNVENFALNDAILGDAIIDGNLNKNKSAIILDAKMQDRDLNKTRVTGYVSPKYNSLDLHIDAGGTNIALIAPFVDGIMSNINGRAHGYVRLFGDFKHLDLEGELRTSFESKIDVLNTYFRVINDSVHIKSGEIAFNNLKIQDNEGNKGVLNGYLHHQKLKNLTYNFNVKGDNLLMYNTTLNDELPFYGKIYATGSVDIDGGYNAMNVNAKLTTAKNTAFTYITTTPNEATDNQFIKFVDKTPHRENEFIKTDIYHYADSKEEEEEKGPPMDLRINMSIETTPDATMKIIMDPIAGDNITARGKGNLRVNYYNKGDFRIFGTYTIDSGDYKLSMQEIIRKDFTLKQGGTVTFTGDPYESNLDVQAVYTVNSASLSDLGMTNIQGRQSSVKVNCLMNLTGKLSSPDIKFDLDLPTLNEEDKAYVRSATSTEEQMNTQIIYLLGIGKFYTYDYTNDNQQSSNATSSLAFSTLSGQLNNLLSQWMENKNWNIGANLSTGEKGWTDVEAQAMLSGRLLNNRLQINGNFGYKDNTMSNNSFVGDFEAIWRLTKNGDWHIRGYNQTNDKYYIKSTLTTQGVGLMYKKDFNKWKDLFNRILWWRRPKNKENE